jgi:3-dehydroquinate synthase
MAADLSARLGLMPADFVARLKRVCERAGLPVRAPALGAERWLALMGLDKKAEGGEIRFVVIERLGSARMQAAPEALVREVIAAHGGA